MRDLRLSAPCLLGSLSAFLAVSTFLASTAGAQECETRTGCQQLRPADGAKPGAHFGSSVAVRDAVASVGSPERNAVTVFDWNGEEWEAPPDENDLVCPDCSGPELFGLSIAFDESRLAVGAPRAGQGGRVYRYQRSDGPWMLAEKLLGASGENFGWSVTLEGDFLVVGAPRSDDSKGKVYVYDWRGNQLGSLSVSEGLQGDQFGIAVALDRRPPSRDRRLLAVGAPFAEGTGLVYVYELTKGQAPPQKPLKVLRPSDGDEVDAFGFAVAVDGDKVVVGSPQHDEKGSNSGAVYFYERNGASWAEFKTTGNASQTRSGDQFGIAVALQGGKALVGARRNDAAAPDAGAIYFFNRHGSRWDQTDRWLGAHQPGAELGIAVALDGVSAFAGAHLADAGAIDSGAAYALGDETDLLVSLPEGEPVQVLPGENVSYEFTIENRGATDVRCGKARFEPAMVLENARWTECGERDTSTCMTPDDPLIQVFDLEGDESLTCKLGAQVVAQPGNNMAISKVFLDLPPGVFDSKPKNNDRKTPDPVNRKASLYLRIVAEDGSDVAVPGRELSWSFRVRNEGPREVHGASFMGRYYASADDAVLTHVSVSCEDEGDSSCSCSKPSSCPNAREYFCDTPNLADGCEVVYRLRAQVEVPADVGQLRLTASVSVDPQDGINNEHSTPGLCRILSLESQQTCKEEKFSIARYVCPFGDDVCDGEFQVNTSTTEVPYLPAVAGRVGELAVVWLSRPESLGSPMRSLQGRRLVPGGSQSFQVDSSTGFPTEPAIDLDEAGNSVVVWGNDGPGSGLEILGRRFKDGAPRGDELLISPAGGEYPPQPDVAVRPSGGFIVVWIDRRDSELPDIGESDVYGQLFNARGEPQGSRFMVNTYTSGPQHYPALAVDDEGDFVVVWTSGDVFGSGLPGSAARIRGQRFRSNGTRRGAELEVDSATGASGIQPDIGMDDAGNFVVVWTSHLKANKLGRNIQGRLFTSDGRAQGEEFQVNQTTDGLRRRPRVVLDRDGSFLVVWENLGPKMPTSVSSIVGRRFTSDGRALASELEIASTTAGSLRDPAVVRAADDLFVFWSSDATNDDIAIPSIRGRRVTLEQDGSEEPSWRLR